MSKEEKKMVKNICESLKKATPTQREYMMGFAEGLAYASQSQTDNENANQNQED